MKFRLAVLLFLSLPPGAVAQEAARCPAPVAGAIAIAGDVSKPFVLTSAVLAELPRAEIRAEGHGTPAATYSGVPLRALLSRAGVVEGAGIRGRAAAQVIVVEAGDGYRASFALAETDTAFTNRPILVADKMDGKPLTAEYGPFQIIVGQEKRHARWVRQVTCIRVVQM